MINRLKCFKTRFDFRKFVYDLIAISLGDFF